MNPFKKVLGFVIKKPLDAFGNTMKKTSLRFQYESALSAYGLIMLSLIVMTAKLTITFFITWDWWNIFYAVNTLLGVVILYSQMVASYMSYLQVLAAMEFQNISSTLSEKEEPNTVKGGIEQW